MDTKSNYERGEREMRLGVGHNRHVWVHVETVLESFRVGELTPWKPVQYRKLKWLNLYQPLDASSTSILLYLRYLKTQVALTRVHVELVLCLFRGYFNDIDAFLAFVRLLNNTHQAACTYLPYSITRVGMEQELLVLFWKCLEEIPALMPYILKKCDVAEILVPICFFLLEGRKEPSKMGLIYICTFTLLKQY